MVAVRRSVFGFGTMAAVLVLTSGCGVFGSQAGPVEPVVIEEPPIVVTEPTEPAGGTEIDPNRPDLGRPGFETPDIILRCGDHQMSGEIFPDRIELALDGGDYVLFHVDSEEGNMFTDGTYTLWTLENEWGFMDEISGEAYECFQAAIQ